MINLKNINKPNPEKVVKILNALKVLFGSLSTAAMALGSPWLSFSILAGGGIVDFIISICYGE